jgi:hypothetical protein
MSEITAHVDGRPVVADVPVAFPGRWVGGAVGAVASAGVGIALLAVTVAADDQGLLPAAAVAFLGIPVAFVLGRHLAPVAHDGGSGGALAAALTFALLAPPLGDLEIIGGLSLSPWASGGTVDVGSAVFGAFFVGGIGLVVSYVALPVTAAVALVWIVLMRSIPVSRFARFEAPPWLARFGVRHVALAAAVALIVAWTAWAIVAPPRVSPWP